MPDSLERVLTEIVGRDAIVRDPSNLLTYESDGLAMHRATPRLVCLPRDTEQAAACMRAIVEAGVPVVSRGAGTGLSGGAVPVEGGVVLSTARMRQLLELDVENRFARVQAGLVNAELSALTAPHGLMYAPDPSSQMACTLGGNVGENSGGPHCFKHGSTTRHILGLVLVTARGEVIDLSQPSAEPEGLDLCGFFIGSEGTLGLATEITVGLVPIPECTETLLGVFDSLDAACGCVSEIIRQQLEPSAIEILDRLTIEAVEDSVFAAGYPRDAEAVVLMDIDGSEVHVDTSAEQIVTLLKTHSAIETRRASDAAERKQLWAGRKGAFGAMGRVAPDLYVADVVAPRTKLREIVAATTEICRRYDLKLANVFHAGDGNLHPNICYDRRDSEEVERV